MDRKRQRKTRRRARARGAAMVEYLIVLSLVAVTLGGALAYKAGPSLMGTFRATQRAAAAPIP